MKPFRVTLRSGHQLTVMAESVKDARERIRKGLGEDRWINPEAIDSIEVEAEKVPGVKLDVGGN